MLEFYTTHRTAAGGLSRRQWLRLSGLAGLGLLGSASADCRRLDHSKETRRALGGPSRSFCCTPAAGRARSIPGTPSPRPRPRSAASSMPIQTSVPGVQLCEHMPLLARAADKYTIVRSVTHDDLDHGSATLSGADRPVPSAKVLQSAAAADRLSDLRRDPEACAARRAVSLHGRPHQRSGAGSYGAGPGPERRLPRPRGRSAGAGRCDRRADRAARLGPGSGRAGGARRVPPHACWKRSISGAASWRPIRRCWR